MAKIAIESASQPLSILLYSFTTPPHDLDNMHWRMDIFKLSGNSVFLETICDFNGLDDNELYHALEAISVVL